MRQNSVYYLLCYWTLLLLLVSVISYGAFTDKRIKHESMQTFNSLKKVAPSDKSAEHEVVIAISLKNLDELEKIVLDITNPDSPNYSKWMTTDEVIDMTKNDEAVQNVTQWLKSHNVSITWESLGSYYMKAVTNISTWENILETKFYDWIDNRRNTSLHKQQMFRGSLNYSIPQDLEPHISAIFRTCQAPPLITHHSVPKPGSGHNPVPIEDTGLSESSMSVDTKHMKLRPRLRKQVAVGSNVVTVGMLNSYYYVPYNSIKKISSLLNQSVFETSQEYFSPVDLTTFQKKYNLPVQSALVENGFSIAVCPTNGCNEGNLDTLIIS